MKILSPFSKKEETIPLIEAGADELYCGIIPPNWYKKYSALEILSRRGGFESNFSSFDDLEVAIQEAHSKRVPVFVALNVPYVTSQYPMVMDIVKKLTCIGADGFIVVDIGLLLLLKKYKIKKQIHIGTNANVFNSKTAEFYKKLGANRIVLPRDLTLVEIRGLLKKTTYLNIDFEVFILNTLCHNVDGLCSFFHNILMEPKKNFEAIENLRFIHSYDTSLKGSGCEINFREEAFNVLTKQKITNRFRCINNSSRERKYSDACGACMIPVLNKLGIKYIKIAERGRVSDEKIKFVEFLKKSLELVKNINEAKAYIKEIKVLYKGIFKKECREVACYYG